MYKVGDEVLVKGKVVKVDGTRVPYKVDIGDGDYLWRSAADILPVPAAPTFGVGDKVMSPDDGDKVFTIDKVERRATLFAYHLAEAGIFDSWRAESDLRPAKPATSYTFRVASPDDIDWRRICEEAAPETDVIKVTRADDSTAWLFRRAWLQKAPQDMDLSYYSVGATLAMQKHNYGIDVPDGWCVRIPGPRKEDVQMSRDIAAIRAAIAAKEAAAKKIEVTVEVV